VGSALCTPGHAPVLVVVPAQTGSGTQNTPGAPSTLIGLLPVAHPFPETAAVDVGVEVAVVVAGAVVVAVGVGVGAEAVGAEVGVIATVSVVAVGAAVAGLVDEDVEPTLQPNTPEDTRVQYDPLARPSSTPGQAPVSVVVPAHTGSLTQYTPGAPSTLMGLLPAAHVVLPLVDIVVVVDVGVGAEVEAAGADVVEVGATVVATGVVVVVAAAAVLKGVVAAGVVVPVVAAPLRTLHP
jgi:hypothetical protein